MWNFEHVQNNIIHLSQVVHYKTLLSLHRRKSIEVETALEFAECQQGNSKLMEEDYLYSLLREKKDCKLGDITRDSAKFLQ